MVMAIIKYFLKNIQGSLNTSTPLYMRILTQIVNYH